MKFTSRIISLILVMVLLIGAVPMNAFAAGDIMYGIAYVDASSLRMRASATTSSAIVSSADRGELVVVVEKSGDWCKVIYNLQEGYMHSDYLDLQTTGNAELGYGTVNGTNVNLRSGAGTSYSRVATADKGDKAYIVGIQNGWYKVIYNSSVCYIRSDFLDLTEIPYENEASSKSPLFFKDGKSTGVTVSAEALNGAPSSNVPSGSTEAEPPVDNSASDSKDDTTASTPSGGVVHGIAFITGSGLRLRASASTSAKTLGSASKGEVVVVLAKEGVWYKVLYNLTEGYMHSDYLNVKTTGNAELGYGKVNVGSVNVRSGAGASNALVTTASRDEKVYIVGVQDGWYQVICGSHMGYIRSDYVTLSEIPYENKASSNSPRFFRGGVSTGLAVSPEALNGSGNNGNNQNNQNNNGSSSVTGDQIVAKAKQYLGTPYKYGGSSPSGFDCSGFVYYVLKSMGIKVNRTSSSMYAQGTPIAKSDLQPGDIVFFQNTYKAGISHVGIYVGDGKFIHSPSSGKVVSYADLNSDYYTSHYYGAARFH